MKSSTESVPTGFEPAICTAPKELGFVKKNLSRDFAPLLLTVAVSG